MTAPLSPAAAIINPNAGSSTRPSDTRPLAEHARRAFAEANLSGEIVFTERAGHARELGISLRPERAIATAAWGIDRTIDVGELSGRLFVNLAGVGLDASVASLFNRLAGRGLLRYVQATLSLVFSYVAQAYTITAGEETFEHRALIVELANGRQYGYGALVAPHAKLDDGLLDLVVVGPLSPLRALWGVRRLFNGTIDQEPDVSMRTASSITISAEQPIRFHVDGEVVEGSETLTATVHPGTPAVRTGIEFLDMIGDCAMW